MGDLNRTVDVNLRLKSTGAITASAACQVDGSAQILDVGQAEFAGMVEIDVSALKITANDETYDIVMQGSSDSDFGTAANIVELGGIHLGAKEIKRTDSDADDATGRYLLPFINIRNGTTYRYLRLYMVVGGTSPSFNFTAHASRW